MNTAPSSSESSFSFTQLFGLEISGLLVDRIEIPLIQRDYAQGRQGDIAAHVTG